jgi:Zn-dependent peptidase ImmA (M78 family)
MSIISDDEMEDRAAALHRELAISIDAPDLLTCLQALKTRGFLKDYVTIPDSQMAGIEARYEASERKIYLSSSVAAALRNGEPRARWTVAHEIGHLALRHQSRNRLSTGRSREAFNSGQNRDEIDANRFAASFLAPANSTTVKEITSADGLARRFIISRQAAERRFDEFQRFAARHSPKGRALPPKVLDFLAQAARRGHKLSTSLRDEVTLHTASIASKYEGDPCPNPACGQLRMVRRGLNCVCEACGARAGSD